MEKGSLKAGKSGLSYFCFSHEPTKVWFPLSTVPSSAPQSCFLTLTFTSFCESLRSLLGQLYPIPYSPSPQPHLHPSLEADESPSYFRIRPIPASLPFVYFFHLLWGSVCSRVLMREGFNLDSSHFLRLPPPPELVTLLPSCGSVLLFPSPRFHPGSGPTIISCPRLTTTLHTGMVGDGVWVLILVRLLISWVTSGNWLCLSVLQFPPAVDWMFISPQPSNSICWILIPHVMVFGDGAFRRWLGHEGGVLMYEISSLRKETPESSLTLSAMRGRARRWLSVNQEAPWSWTSQPLEQ